MKYRSDIDGLRALAVVPILLFHAGVTTFSGGFVGVDIFFVISGFLITTILRDDLAAGRFSILTFYERRARRILPALVFTLILTTLAALWLLLPPQLIDYGQEVVATSTFTANIYFWKHSGYFEAGAHLRPLLHTWSLAVEEQFYLIVPVAVWAVWRFVRRAEMAVLLIALAASLGLSVYMAERGPTANFFLLPTRAWELLFGSFVAVLPVRHALRGAANSGVALLGLALILVPIFVYTEDTPFPGLGALPPVLGTALLIWTGRSGATHVSRLLSQPVAVWIGKISYSLYLVHWPICVFMLQVTLDKPGPLQILAILGLSFALALISYHWIEQPFRARRLFAARPALLGASVAVLVVCVAAGLAIGAMRGLPARLPGWGSAQAGETFALSYNNRNGTCFFVEDWAYSRWKADKCEIVRGPGEVERAGRVLLWGDSYSAHYVPGLQEVGTSQPLRIWEIALAGCPPVLSYHSYARPSCREFNAKVMQVIEDLDIGTVILSARWTELRSRGLETLQPTIDALRARGLRVFVIGQSPVFVTEVPIISWSKSGGLPDADWVTAVPKGLNDQLAAASQGATFIDPMKLMCDADGRCPYRREGHLLFSDNGHYSHFGSLWAVKRYFPLIGGTAP